MMITAHQTPQGSDAWKQARVGKFTGSGAYKLLGSFGASEYAKAIDDSFRGNFYTKRGGVLEEEAIELYEKIKRVTVDRPGYITNDKYPTALYSPDGIDGEILLEVKCFGEKPHMAIYNGDIPVKVLAQIHFGMLICEKKSGRLIIYNPELADEIALKIIDIPYNRNIASNFKRILTKGAIHV